MSAVLNQIAQCFQLNSALTQPVNAFFHDLYRAAQVMHGRRVYQFIDHQTDEFRSHETVLYPHDIQALSADFQWISREVSDWLGIESVDQFVRSDATLATAHEQWTQIRQEKDTLPEARYDNLDGSELTFLTDLRRDSWMLGASLIQLDLMGLERARQLILQRANLLKEDYIEIAKTDSTHRQERETLLFQARALYDHDLQTILYLIAILGYWNAIPFNFPLRDEGRLPGAWGGGIGPEWIAAKSLTLYFEPAISSS